jgi:hypothetical protein
MALEIARQAENAFRLEVCEPLDGEPRMIRAGHWDSLRSGLLAGGRLHADLKRMEARYMDLNRRRFEIFKSISLRQFFPAALVELKTSGSCTVALPEWLYDMDHPGHYQRRIKSVAMSIPCVTGPYSSLNCTLIMTRDRVRMNAGISSGYAATGIDDGRFYSGFGRDEAIVTSRGVNDSGLFQTDLRDERLLPFEGAGAESTWSIELPAETNYFDINTISDVVLHVQYTALPGGTTLRNAALASLRSILPSQGCLLLEINREFASEWSRFTGVPADAVDPILTFTLRREHFPFFAQNKAISVTKIHGLVAADSGVLELEARICPPGGSFTPAHVLGRSSVPSGSIFAAEIPISPANVALGEWRIQVYEPPQTRAVASLLRSLTWVVEYSFS